MGEGVVLKAEETKEGEGGWSLKGCEVHESGQKEGRVKRTFGGGWEGTLAPYQESGSSSCLTLIKIMTSTCNKTQF